MKSKTDTLPRVLSAGINFQLPWVLSFLKLHIGASPALKAPNTQPKTIDVRSILPLAG
jgi:hypothetical protein